MLSRIAAEVMKIHHTYAKLPEQHRQALNRGREKLLQAATIAAKRQEGQHGSDCLCVKRLLQEAQSNSKQTLLSTGK